MDTIFAVKAVQEKYIEQQMASYAVFIDLTKTSGTADTTALWTVLEHYGCPKKFVNIIQIYHNGMTGWVLISNEASSPFEVKNGVKQGCVLALVPFNLFSHAC